MKKYSCLLMPLVIYKNALAKGLLLAAILSLASSPPMAWALESASVAQNNTNPAWINVNWNDSYGAYCMDLSYCTYEIQRKSGSNGAWITIATLNVDGTYGSYVDVGSPGFTYYYRVKLIDDCGCFGGNAFVEAGNITLSGTPSAPSGLTASLASATQVNLSWTDNSSGQTRFSIERKTGSNGSWNVVGILNAGITSYKDNDLQPATTYYYRIKGTAAFSESAYTDSNSVTTGQSAVNAPGTPGGLSAVAASSSQINLTWGNVSGEAGYKIERRTGSSPFSQIATVAADTTSYSDTGLNGGTTYSYQVRATNSGVDSGFSGVANATTLSGGTSSKVGKRTSAFEYDAATGLLTKEIIEPDNSVLCLVTTYVYDGYGNRTSATTRNCNGGTSESAAPSGEVVIQNRTSSTVYDASGRFATSAINALNQSEARSYHNSFGSITSLTGPNGLSTTWTYDTFGRKTLETRADGTRTKWEYLFCSGVNGGNSSCPTGGKYLVRITPQNVSGSPNGANTTTYFDQLGREIRSETQGFDGTTIYKDTEYDSLGRVYRSSNPWYANSSPVWMVFQYDLLGRVIQQTAPNGGVLISNYNGLTTVITDQQNHSETRIKNSQGQLIQVTRQ